MLVREVMTRDIVTVMPETPVKSALILLEKRRITSVPVLTGSGRLVGVVSEADLIRDLVTADPRAHELPLEDDRHDRPTFVSDVMTPHAVTVHPDTELVVAVELITSTSVKSLPVVDERGAVVGIVSRSDVVRVLARSDEELGSRVDALLDSSGLGDWFVEVHEGTVDLTGPEASEDATVARILAATVPGVLEVRVS
jgi:CBS-domain-containing membrane protein